MVRCVGGKTFIYIEFVFFSIDGRYVVRVRVIIFVGNGFWSNIVVFFLLNKEELVGEF